MANVVADKGRDITTNRLRGLGTEPKWIDWGTSAETALVTDTGINTPGGEARTDGTSSRITTAVLNDTYQVQGVMTANANKTITIVALFDAATGGNLFAKANFTGIPLTQGDGINWTLRVQFA